MANEYQIPKEKFTFVNNDRVLKDEKFSDKSIGYFKDAFLRFRKNKGAIVAAIIIILQLLFAVFVPMFSHYTVDFREDYYKTVLPRLAFNREHNLGFWDGVAEETGGQSLYDLYDSIGYEMALSNENTEKRGALLKYETNNDNGVVGYTMQVDSYYKVAFEYMNLSEKEYLALQEYQNRTGIQVIYPLQKNFYSVYADYWYKLDGEHQAKATAKHQTRDLYERLGKAPAMRDANGNYVPDYRTSFEPNAFQYNSLKLDLSGTSYPDGAPAKRTLQFTSAPEEYKNNEYALKQDTDGVIYYPYNVTNNGTYVMYAYQDAENNNQWTPSYRFDMDGNLVQKYENSWVDVNADDVAAISNVPEYYAYAFKNQTGYKVRVCYYEYFRYLNGYEPTFLFGTNSYGQDIFTCLAVGARLSFLLAFAVSAINLTLGAIYGAIEGYYGGTVDIIMERCAEILSSVPFIIVATLFQMHLASKVNVVVALLFAFVLTGWLGMAARTRMQFYRFKSQEYVLAARTLGAKDRRIIWKHIFPNTLGTLITGSILSIPGVIFSESMLSYLNIVNFETSSMTSIGTMLAQGQGLLSTFPHVIIFPAVFIALLEISFNLFGNGLRDAFNPSLRGSDE